MKNSTKRLLLAASAIFAFSGMAEAKHGSDRNYYEGHYENYDEGPRYGERKRSTDSFNSKMHNRQNRQRERIQNGRKIGRLTSWEVRELRQDQKAIKKLIRQAAKDGHFARWERRRITDAQDRAGERIRHLKHNNVSAHNRGYRESSYIHRPSKRYLRRDFPFYWLDL